MPTCADIQGVRSVDYYYATEFEVDAQLQVAEPLLNRLGEFQCAKTYGARNDFSIRGKGAMPDGLVAGEEIEIDSLDEGVTLLKSTREEQRAGQYHEWSVQGSNYPHAVPMIAD
jgi:hypothetical protein